MIISFQLYSVTLIINNYILTTKNSKTKMYNGVGLQTARGSGTSGYVQRNLSHVLPGAKPKLQDYGKILKELMDAPQPLPKPPNQELITHEKKRQIESKVFTLGKKLRAEGQNDEEQIKTKLNRERQRL